MPAIENNKKAAGIRRRAHVSLAIRYNERMHCSVRAFAIDIKSSAKTAQTQ